MIESETIKLSAMFGLTVGVLCFVMGALQWGVIINFMSHSVMSAFTTGCGLTIAISQLKYLFGIVVPRKKYAWQTVAYIVSHLDETKIQEITTLGLT